MSTKSKDSIREMCNMLCTRYDEAVDAREEKNYGEAIEALKDCEFQVNEMAKTFQLCQYYAQIAKNGVQTG